MGKKAAKTEVKSLVRQLERFKKANRFEMMILFGSYATGNYNKDSDVDLIIIDKRFGNKSASERSSGLWIKWHLNQKMSLPVDFLCYTPEEFSEMGKRITIVSEALREGIKV